MAQEKSEEVSLGLIQMACGVDPKENLGHALTLIDQAASRGAHIVALPELFSSLYFCQENDKKHFALAEPVPGPTTEALSAKAREKGLVLVGSIFEKAPDGNCFNTAVVLDADGSLKSKYRKVHIPDDPKNHYSELFYFKPGNLGYVAARTRFGSVGTLVCWDQWYPEAARATVLKGAEILFYPTAIGWQLTEKEREIGKKEFDAWVTIQRSHAIANTVFVASVNRTGGEGAIDFWGGSFVCDPFGKILAQGPHDKEEVLLVPIDLGQIASVREDWPFLTCRRVDLIP